MINSDPVAWKTQLSEERKLAEWRERIFQADVYTGVPLIMYIWPLCVDKPLVHIPGLGIFWENIFEYKCSNFALGLFFCSDFIIVSNLISLLIYIYFPTRRSEALFYI